MKRHLPVLAVILLATGVCSGQTKYRDAEVGINLGFSNFLGDLGGSRMEGRALWWDIDPEVTRPAIRGDLQAGSSAAYQCQTECLLYADTRC